MNAVYLDSLGVYTNTQNHEIAIGTICVSSTGEVMTLERCSPDSDIPEGSSMRSALAYTTPFLDGSFARQSCKHGEMSIFSQHNDKHEIGND